MTIPVKLKRSNVAGNAPSTAQLEYGELAINTYDGVLYIKRDPGTGAEIVKINSNAGGVYTTLTTVSLASNATVVIATIPAGSTVMSVRVIVSTVNPTATLSVGDNGGTVDRYMTTAENNPQIAGLYIAQVFDTDGSAVDLEATVAAQTTSVGTCTVAVEYRLA